MKIFSLFCLLFVSLTTTQTFAATFTVTTSADTGAGSLRAAVTSANTTAGDDIITFAAGVTTITLASEIEITNNGALSITGNGADVLTIGGAGTNRIFYINNAAVTITGVTLTGGNGAGTVNSGFGNAIYVDAGTTVLDSVVVQTNVGTGGGGAVYFSSGANHRIVNSTFSANTGAACAGFYSVNSTLTVTNSTISGNQASGDVGGGGCVVGGTVTIRNSTVTENSATGGGGIFVNGTLDLGNTIVAGNTATNNSFPEIYYFNGTITSVGYNLVGDSAGDSTNTSLPITYQTTDIRNVNPMLGALTTMNGGTTPTRALLFGSPALDKGFRFGSTTDQRGFTRPVNILTITNAAGGDGSDIGAFEAQLAPTAAAVGVGGRVMTAKGTGIQNVVVTMTDSEGNIRTAHSTGLGYYRFDDVMAGETYVLSVRGKRYTFTEQTQVRSINEETNDINFIGYSEKGFK